MSIETEIKVKIEDPASFCRRLNALNAVIVSSRHFEDNQLLDFADQRLSSNRCLLRIRFADDRDFLTYKGPPRLDSIFKVREEIEIKLEDGATMLQILAQLGMHVCFQYQKYRQEYALDGVLVAVDETPIGNYVEFEGSEQGIRDLTRRMGIPESLFLRLSYFSLYLEYCQKRKTAPQFMTF